MGSNLPILVRPMEYEGERHRGSRPPHILWVGPVFDEPDVLRNRAVSPAANKWQLAMIRALVGAGENVRVLGHLPDPLWPKGRLHLSKVDARLPDDISGEIVGYWNVPAVRKLSLRRAYLQGLRRIVHDAGPPRAVITYNITLHDIAVGQTALRQWSAPWIPVIADAPGEPRAFEDLMTKVQAASGQVFLSWQTYTSSAARRKLHLDGIVPRPRLSDAYVEPHRSPQKVIFYSGTISDREGVRLLIDAFKRLNDPSVELWLCGKIAYDGHYSELEGNPRISYFGCVPETRLQQLAAQASLLVNPRPNSVDDNTNNFPSKLLDYLSYGKPIVSTWTPGLSPVYRRFLRVLDREDPEYLAATMAEVLGWSETTLEAWRTTVSDFVSEHKSSQQQARRLIELVNAASQQANGPFANES